MKGNRLPSHKIDWIRIYIHELRKELTINEIAQIFKVHHSTVVYHLQKYRDLKDVYPDFRWKIENFDVKTIPKEYLARENQLRRQKKIYASI